VLPSLRHEGIIHFPATTQDIRTKELQPLLLDVRAPNETQANRIAGSINIPLNHLEERVQELPRERKIVVHSGGRVPLFDCREHPAKARL